MRMRFIFEGPEPDEVEVVFTYHCVVCGAIEKAISNGVEVMMPTSPTGWQWLASSSWNNRRWICDKHRAKLEVALTAIHVDYEVEARAEEN